MPSEQVNNTIGALGGAVLAACLAPQLWKLYTTRSAQDLSYIYMLMYTVGLLLTFVYLYFEGAVTGWICILVEMGFAMTLVASKCYLDGWGPRSDRAARRAAQQRAAKLASSLPPGSEIRCFASESVPGAAAFFPMSTQGAMSLLLDVSLAASGEHRSLRSANHAHAAMDDASAAAWTAIKDASVRAGTAMKDLSVRSGAAFRDISVRSGAAFRDASVRSGTAMKDKSVQSGTADGVAHKDIAVGAVTAGASAGTVVALEADGSVGKSTRAGVAARDPYPADSQYPQILQEPADSASADLEGGQLACRKPPAVSLRALADMLDECLASAGLAVQWRQPPAAERLHGNGGEAGDQAGAHMAFFACSEAHVSLLCSPGGGTLSLDLTATSDPATERMAAAAQRFCERLQAAHPGARVAAACVSRVPPR